MGTLMERIEGLSEEAQAKVVEFVEFLEFSERKKKQTNEDTNKPVRTLGIFKGALKYMADDFDETPECFKEYM